ncbi:YcnI family protein [Paenibacillus alginolyticus]|uniref:YcnI family copper-binding membrane protein n=1 Tax=Paenibacillus alginolyticus TaxID=59839 RepID=UPI0004282A86|nr:YcnI family protein [Paenibacillus alginolyticus]MCY9670606.1 YcnI family protein [Paenibacillus alginolyticus]
MKKFFSALSLCFMAMLLFAGIASAHVVVYPQQTTQGSYEKFTVRVPTEKEVPTVKVEIKVPAEVAVSRFEPMAGWKYELTKDGTGKITSVVWTATGEGLSSTEFGEFNMQGKIGDQAASISWKAYQTYKDGSVVEWVGAAGSDKPASVTTVNPKPAAAKTDSDGHDHGGSATAAAHDQETGNSKLPLYLSIAALVLGVLSLFTSLLKKAK